LPCSFPSQPLVNDREEKKKTSLSFFSVKKKPNTTSLITTKVPQTPVFSSDYLNGEGKYDVGTYHIKGAISF